MTKVFVARMEVTNGYEAEELGYDVVESWEFDPPLPVAENIIDDGYLFGQAVRAGAAFRGFDSAGLAPEKRGIMDTDSYEGIGIGEHD